MPALQRVDGEPGPSQQAPQVVDAAELAHGVEAPVEDAVAGLKLGEQPLEGLGGRPRLGWKVGGLGILQLLPHPFQARRVLPDEELRGEVEGVERPGEGPKLRLVQLQAHHLAHPQLDPVQAHRAVVVEVGQHEEQGQLGRELGSGWLDRAPGRFVGSGGVFLRPLRSSSCQSSNKLFQQSVFLFSRGLGSPRGRCLAARPGPWPTAPGPVRPPP